MNYISFDERRRLMGYEAFTTSSTNIGRGQRNEEVLDRSTILGGIANSSFASRAVVGQAAAEDVTACTLQLASRFATSNSNGNAMMGLDTFAASALHDLMTSGSRVNVNGNGGHMIVPIGPIGVSLFQGRGSTDSIMPANLLNTHAHRLVPCFSSPPSSQLATDQPPPFPEEMSIDGGGIRRSRNQVMDRAHLHLLSAIQDINLFKHNRQLLTRRATLSNSLLQSQSLLGACSLFPAPNNGAFATTTYQTTGQHGGAQLLGAATQQVLYQRSPLPSTLMLSSGPTAKPSNSLRDSSRSSQERKGASKNNSMLIFSNTSGGRGTFPVLLHRVLRQLESHDEGSRIAKFMPDGKSFQITNQSLLEKNVLPIYFPKMKGFPSFQRQLNLYDFKRVGGSGADRGAYRHELFVRDDPIMASQMKRRRLKGAYRRNVQTNESPSRAVLISESDHST